MAIQTLLKTAVSCSDGLLTYKAEDHIQRGNGGLLEMVSAESSEAIIDLEDDHHEQPPHDAQFAVDDREYQWSLAGCLRRRPHQENVENQRLSGAAVLTQHTHAPKVLSRPAESTDVGHALCEAF